VELVGSIEGVSAQSGWLATWLVGRAGPSATRGHAVRRYQTRSGGRSWLDRGGSDDGSLVYHPR
jgi:hypothetical protein